LFLLNETLVGKHPDGVKLDATPFGPSAAGPVMPAVVTTDASQFTRTAADVGDYLRKHGRVPSAVWLGSAAVTPEAYLMALAKVVLAKDVPPSIELTPTPLLTAKHVQDDNPKLWGWVIFPPEFKAPAMMELAKRQAWALKPAVRGK
jgi:hypothetical protein